MSCSRKKKKKSRDKLTPQSTQASSRVPKRSPAVQKVTTPQPAPRQSPNPKQAPPQEQQVALSIKAAPSARNKPKNMSIRMEAKNPAAEVKSQYVKVPKTPKASVPASSSYADKKSSDEGQRSSIRRLKDFSARTIRKVKTFVSRPVNEQTLKKVAKRVEQRKVIDTASHPLTHGEDLFPKPKPAPRKKNPSTKDNVFASSLQTNCEEKSIIKLGTLSSGTILIKNNDNNGELFVEKYGEDKPFWTVNRRPTDDDLEESTTDNDLQLNAEVVLDVMNGKVKLVDMPTVPVVLDPMNEANLLPARDKLFFNSDILFGNTVRTMINLSDQASIRATPRRKQARLSPLNFTEPETYMTYKEGTWDKFEERPIKSKNE